MLSLLELIINWPKNAQNTVFSYKNKVASSIQRQNSHMLFSVRNS